MSNSSMSDQEVRSLENKIRSVRAQRSEEFGTGLSDYIDMQRQDEPEPEPEGTWATVWLTVRAWVLAVFSFLFYRPFFSATVARETDDTYSTERVQTLADTQKPYRAPDMELEPLSRAMRVAHVANAERAYDAITYLRDRLKDLRDDLGERVYTELDTTVAEAQDTVFAIAGRVVRARQAVEDMETWIDQSVPPEQRGLERRFGSLMNSRAFRAAFVKAAGQEPNDTVKQMRDIVSASTDAEIGAYAIEVMRASSDFSDTVAEYVKARTVEKQAFDAGDVDAMRV